MDKKIESNSIPDDKGIRSEYSTNSASSQLPNQSIKKNAIYNLISKLLTLLIPVITTPYLARVLGEEGNGQISFVLSVISYFSLFAALGFSIYGQREIAKHLDNRQERSVVFWEIFVTKLVTTLISLGVFASIFFTVGFGDQYNNLFFIMSIQVIAVIFDIEFLYTGQSNFKAIALRNIGVKIIGVVLIFVFVRTQSDIWIYALYLSASVLFACLIMWVGLHRMVNIVPIKTLKPWKHIKGALIVFLPVVITSLFTTFDKTMIGLLSPNPDYDNGCYEQAYKINTVAQSFILIFSSVTMSRNVFDFKCGNIASMNERVYKTSRYIWLSSVFFVVGFLVLSKNFSSWFLGDGYYEVPLLFCIMSIRLLVSGFSTIFGDRFIAMGKEKQWMLSVLVAALTNIIANYFMIPIYGAIGAAIATALCEVMIMLIMGFLTFKDKGLSLKRMVLPGWKYIVAGGFSFGVMYLMQYFLVNAIWSFVTIGITGGCVYALILFILKDSFFIEMVQMVLNRVKKFFRR